MFDLGLFRIREFSASSIAMFLNALARGAFSFVLVFYLQGPPHDLSPISAGLSLVPVSVSLAAFGPISGSLSDRWGPSGLAITGLVVSAIGFLVLTTVGPGTTFLELLPAFVLVGAGMGIFAAPNRAAMMNAVAPHRRGIAAGTGTTLINAGTTLSLGLAIAVMGRSMSTADLEGVFLGLGRGPALPLDPFLAAVHLVFFVSAALLLAAVIPSVWRRRGHSRTAPAKAPDSGRTLGE
jgi:MFS family permease